MRNPRFLNKSFISTGAGNFPTNRLDLLKELEEASKRGVIIVNCTQCGHGTVAAIYETGVKTESAGVIPGFDMTCEAALTKLSYVLGRTEWSLEKKREMMKVSLRGEMTSPHTLTAKEFTMNMEESLPAVAVVEKPTNRAPRPVSQPILIPSSNSRNGLNDGRGLVQLASSSPTVLNNGDVIPPRHPHSTLNMNDMASLLGQPQGRSPMWQIASIIFAGQLLLMACVALVL